MLKIQDNDMMLSISEVFHYKFPDYKLAITINSPNNSQVMSIKEEHIDKIIESLEEYKEQKKKWNASKKKE